MSQIATLQVIPSSSEAAIRAAVVPQKAGWFGKTRDVFWETLHKLAPDVLNLEWSGYAVIVLFEFLREQRGFDFAKVDPRLANQVLWHANRRRPQVMYYLSPAAEPNMRATILAVIVAIVSSAIGCDRESKPEPASSASIVYRSPDGRVITQEELKNVSGTFKYEIVGGESVPDEARQLHDQARAAGGRGEYDNAIALLQRAAKAAPQWPYPIYDLAYTYLLKQDFDNARVYYRKTLDLSPRGFFTAITALDTLDREKKGELPAGLYFAYLSLEWMDNATERANIVQQLAERQPAFSPGLKERALLADDDTERLQWIEKGLAANPDVETKGILLINKALLLNKRGEKDAAVKLLGQLAVDPKSTFATEHLAKATLANIIASGGRG